MKGGFAYTILNYDTSRIAEYTYDANGSVMKDNNKGIAGIIYNNLNLPLSVAKTGGNSFGYIYRAI